MSDKVSATLDESAMLALVAAWPEDNATPAVVADFLDASDDPAPDGGLSERATIINGMRLRSAAPEASSWDKFLEVLNVVLTIAGGVSTIAGAITGAYAVATL